MWVLLAVAFLKLKIKNMKLELKHIAPYLPYKLKAKFPETNKKGCRSYVVGIIGALYYDCTIVCHETVNATPDRFKPLLRPLSLYEDINYIYFANLNCDIQNQIEITELACKRIGINQLTFGTLEICLKNHIDIFNLIPNGLAVAI